MTQLKGQVQGKTTELEQHIYPYSLTINLVFLSCTIISRPPRGVSR